MPFAAQLRIPESNSLSLFPRSQQSHLSEVACERLDLSERSRVLDIGCGKGANALEIARRTGAQVIGVDEDASLIVQANQARRNLENAELRALFFSESPEQLPFAERAFDLVYCDRFQDRSSDLERLSGTMVDLIKDDGSIVLSTLYQRRDVLGCRSELREWLGDSHVACLLGDVISRFEGRGMLLDHFMPLDEYLGAYIESMIWSSLLDEENEQECAWGNRLSRPSACSLLKAVDNRDIGYAALVLKKEPSRCA